jgi:mannitol-1-/sugar-/sorbitol-6-phosphatase
MPFMCDAIIFDLDGVLIDSNAIAERHLRAWAQRHGVPLEHIAAIHHGRTTVETVRLVAPHLDAATEAEAMETAEADDVDGLVAFPGAARLLARLPAGRWAIATSGTRRTATLRLAYAGLASPDVLITADDVTKGKPAPDPYLLAAKRLGLLPSRCVVVEDAPAGIASAHAAGARVIGVASSMAPEKLAGADVIVASLEDLDVEPAAGTLLITWRDRGRQSA